MTTTIAKVTAFDGTSLDNGTTIRAASILRQTSKANLSLIKLPNGVWYDPNGASEDAPLLPGQITSTHLINRTALADALSDFETIAALVGTRGTITATKTTSGTITASARMIQAVNITGPNDGGNAKVKVNLTFQLITNFS